MTKYKMTTDHYENNEIEITTFVGDEVDGWDSYIDVCVSSKDSRNVFEHSLSIWELYELKELITKAIGDFDD